MVLRGEAGGGRAISYAELAALNCIQLQARCKMCTKVSDRYLIAAALEEAVGAADWLGMPSEFIFDVRASS